MYSLIYSKKAEKQLSKLDKQIARRIIFSIERIRIRPEAYAEKLVGDPGYKFRVGDYRVILDIGKGRIMILVLEIGHRRNIYKK